MGSQLLQGKNEQSVKVFALMMVNVMITKHLLIQNPVVFYSVLGSVTLSIQFIFQENPQFNIHKNSKDGFLYYIFREADLGINEKVFVAFILNAHVCVNS